jgi:hypothetical protein
MYHEEVHQVKLYAIIHIKHLFLNCSSSALALNLLKGFFRALKDILRQAQDEREGKIYLEIRVILI